MQLVGDLRERRPEILPVPNLRVAAPGLERNLRQPWIGQVGHHHCLESFGTAPWRRLRRPRSAAAKPDRVHHHVFLACAIDDPGLARDVPAEVGQLRRAAILPVAQHEHHAPLVTLVFEGVHRLVHRTPERRRRISGNRGWQRLPELARIACEGRTDGHVVPELSHAGEVVRAKPREELFRTRPKQRQVACHAARHVEHDHDSDRLGCVVEHGDRLRLSIVSNFEVVLGETGDQPAIPVHHGDEHADEVGATPEHALLRSRGVNRADEGGGEHPVQEKATHRISPFIRSAGGMPQSYHEPGVLGARLRVAGSFVVAPTMPNRGTEAPDQERRLSREPVI